MVVGLNFGGFFTLVIVHLLQCMSLYLTGFIEILCL
jgi:hypothetical protein